MSEIGLYAIRFALLAAIFGILAGIGSGVTRRADWGQVAERSVYTVLVFLGIAMISLFWSLGMNDFSMEYVARHSARSMTLPYRLGALWGGAGGFPSSMGFPPNGFWIRWRVCQPPKPVGFDSMGRSGFARQCWLLPFSPRIPNKPV